MIINIGRESRVYLGSQLEMLLMIIGFRFTELHKVQLVKVPHYHWLGPGKEPEESGQF